MIADRAEKYSKNNADFFAATSIRRTYRADADSEKSPPNGRFHAVLTTFSRRKLTQRSANIAHQGVENPWNLFRGRSRPSLTGGAHG